MSNSIAPASISVLQLGMQAVHAITGFGVGVGVGGGVGVGNGTGVGGGSGVGIGTGFGDGGKAQIRMPHAAFMISERGLAIDFPWARSG